MSSCRPQRPVVIETTAVGAAFLAGLQCGLYASFDDLESYWQRDARFEPRMDAGERERLLAAWARAVAHVRSD